MRRLGVAPNGTTADASSEEMDAFGQFLGQQRFFAVPVVLFGAVGIFCVAYVWPPFRQRRARRCTLVAGVEHPPVEPAPHRQRRQALMRFYLNAGDSDGGRIARRVSIIDENGLVASMETGRDGLTIRDGDVEAGPFSDPATAGIELAAILHRHREFPLVAHPPGSSALRGNERDTADIYPPARRPRINVEGKG